MQHLHRRYQDILLCSFAWGFGGIGYALLLDLGSLRRFILMAPAPLPIFMIVAALFGAVIATVCFAYELIEQGLAEQAALRRSQELLDNPWTAPAERARLRKN